MKTQFRKELNQELADKLLLKDASVWAITKCLYKRRTTEIWSVLVALIVGIGIGKI